LSRNQGVKIVNNMLYLSQLYTIQMRIALNFSLVDSKVLSNLNHNSITLVRKFNSLY